MGTHYSHAQDGHILMRWAKEKTRILKDLDVDQGQVVLCYTGMSGVAYATALMLELTSAGVLHKMCYIRKPDEKTHGRPVERSELLFVDDGDTYVFVDDFIESGATLRYVGECLDKEVPGVSITHVCLGQVIPFAEKLIENEGLVNI